MLIPAVLLAAVAAALLAAFLVWRPLQRDVQKRVDAAVLAANPRPAQDPSNVSAWRRRIDIFTKAFTFGMKHTWGLKATSLMLLLVGLIAAAAMWLLGSALFQLPVWVTAPSMAAAFWLLPRRIAIQEQAKADQAFLELFPDAIDMIIRMLRAGLPVSAAIRTVAHEAQPPVNKVFAAVADAIDVGVPFEEALGISSEWIGLPDFRFFAAAVALQRTTGGNLNVALEILVDIIRKRRAIRLKVKAATAEERMSAYVLAAMPFLVFGALLVTSPAYLSPLLTDPRGNVILVAGITMLALAYLSMRYLMRSAVRM